MEFSEIMAYMRRYVLPDYIHEVIQVGDTYYFCTRVRRDGSLPYHTPYMVTPGLGGWSVAFALIEDVPDGTLDDILDAGKLLYKWKGNLQDLQSEL